MSYYWRRKKPSYEKVDLKMGSSQLLNKIGAGPVAGLLGFVQLNHLLVLEIGEHVLDPMVSDVRNTRLRGQMHAAYEI